MNAALTGSCRSVAALLFVLLTAVAAQAAGNDSDETRAREVLRSAVTLLCPEGIEAPEALPLPLPGALAGFAFVSVEDRGPSDRWLQRELRLEDDGADLALRISAARAGTALRRVLFEAQGLSETRSLMLLLAGGDCRPQQARAIRYDAAGQALELVVFGPDLESVQSVEPLNPPLPEGGDPGGVTVVHVDSGVNYLLPEIAARLARDESGRPLALDLWDRDGRPFDGDTGRSPFFPIRHGTPVASLLIREAPEIRLLPIRYPRPEMARMTEAVQAAMAAEARIVALPMGSTKQSDWQPFAAAAAAAPDILFIVSAGNDGRDIDVEPLYPARLALDNMIVVTSSDDFGRLAPGSNWGATSVDLMVPAESQEVIDYRGARGTASGSSYAVPRVAALAARLLLRHPDWTAPQLKQAIFARAVPPLERGAPRVAVGWIPNPAEDF